MFKLKYEIELLEREIKERTDKKFIDGEILDGFKEKLSKALNRQEKNKEMGKENGRKHEKYGIRNGEGE